MFAQIRHSAKGMMHHMQLLRRPPGDEPVMPNWDPKAETALPGTGFNAESLTIVRADRELAWVTALIEAAIDGLDEFNGDVVDAMIEHRHAQREQSIKDQAEIRRQQATDAQAQTEQTYVEVARHTEDARRRVADLLTLERTYRQALAGAVPDPLPATTAPAPPLAAPQSPAPLAQARGDDLTSRDRTQRRTAGHATPLTLTQTSDQPPTNDERSA